MIDSVTGKSKLDVALEKLQLQPPPGLGDGKRIPTEDCGGRKLIKTTSSFAQNWLESLYSTLKGGGGGGGSLQTLSYISSTTSPMHFWACPSSRDRKSISCAEMPSSLSSLLPRGLQHRASWRVLVSVLWLAARSCQGLLWRGQQL